MGSTAAMADGVELEETICTKEEGDCDTLANWINNRVECTKHIELEGAICSRALLSRWPDAMLKFNLRD